MTTNVESVFEELKGKELIGVEMKLIPDNKIMDFKAPLIGKKKIFYNPSFSGISKDSLRFVLLHEIGHMQKTIDSTHIALTTATVLSIVAHFLLLNHNMPILLKSTIVILVFLMTFRFYIPLLKKDEFFADTWAANKILEAYPDKKPSEMLKNALEKSGGNNQNSIYKWASGLVYKIIQYHPSIDERIANIKTIENETN